jgi:hypothetical protein
LRKQLLCPLLSTTLKRLVKWKPRRRYRFIGTPEQPKPPGQESAPAAPEAKPTGGKVPGRRWPAIAALADLAAVVAAGTYFLSPRPPALTGQDMSLPADLRTQRATLQLNSAQRRVAFSEPLPGLHTWESLPGCVSQSRGRAVNSIDMRSTRGRDTRAHRYTSPSRALPRLRHRGPDCPNLGPPTWTSLHPENADPSVCRSLRLRLITRGCHAPCWAKTRRGELQFHACRGVARGGVPIESTPSLV